MSSWCSGTVQKHCKWSYMLNDQNSTNALGDFAERRFKLTPAGLVGRRLNTKSVYWILFATLFSFGFITFVGLYYCTSFSTRLYHESHSNLLAFLGPISSLKSDMTTKWTPHFAHCIVSIIKVIGSCLCSKLWSHKSQSRPLRAELPDKERVLKMHQKPLKYDYLPLYDHGQELVQYAA